MDTLGARLDRLRRSNEDPVRGAVERLLEDNRFAHSVTHIHKQPARAAVYAEVPEGVAPAVVRALASCGIERVYTHQAEAIGHVLAGRHTVVVTPTASGKTLCYNAPVLTHLANDRTARALYLFPTKALSRDQTAELNRLIGAIAQEEGPEDGWVAYTYDGDTPADQRRSIRQKAQVVITNPDMLHAAMLPHHPRWEVFLRNLKVVVVDELHTYRGLFGSNVANVFRRLRRICRFYGADPVFVCASATIANPGELTAAIIGEDEGDVAVVSESGAPSSERWMVFYNPPITDPEQQIRQSAVGAATQITRSLLKDRISTIAFARTRTSVEVLLKALRDSLRADRNLVRRIAGYRGGYLPEMRRSIEKGLREGEIVGVVSTNALELGIDIGTLQACVMAGYPGTIASTWQQAGRAGRSDASKLTAAFFIASSRAVDQFMVQNPGYFLAASPEHGRIDKNNLRVLVEHLKCAVFELSMAAEETFGDLPVAEVQEILGFLAEEAGLVRLAGGQWHWTADAYPASTVSLRSIPEENFLVVDVTHAPPMRYGKPVDQKVIAEVDFESAHTALHDDAIYQIDAEQFIVEHLDYENRKAYVRQSHDDYYTLAISWTAIRVLDEFEKSNNNSRLLSGLGEVRVSRRFVGFKKIKFKTQENLGHGEIRLPDLEKHTSAFWLTMPSAELDQWAPEIAAARGWGVPITGAELVGALSGIGRVLHTVACIHVMCDSHDLGHALGSRDARWWAQDGVAGMTLYSSDGGQRVPLGDALALTPDDLAMSPGGARDRSGRISPLHDPTVFLYDVFPGGVGFADGLYALRDSLPRAALALLTGCACELGCPGCVGPPDQVGTRGKAIAIDLLRRGVGETA